MNTEPPASDPIRDSVLAFIRSLSALPTPELAERIRAVQGRVLAATEGISDAEAESRSDPESWSLRDLLRHVIDAEERVTLQIAGLTAGDEPPTYNVPEGVAMQIDDTEDPFSTLVARLKSANAHMLATVERLSADVDLDYKVAHGYFGPMNALEWAGFQVFHDSDHASHAERLAREAHP